MDADRRAAERAASQGDPAAQAQVLAARLRSGDLDRERLHLAALVDHEPAREVLGSDAPEPELELRRWLRRIQDLPGVLDRIELALARCALPAWERALPKAPQPREAVEAYAHWLETGADADGQAFRAAADQALQAGQSLRILTGILNELTTDHLPTPTELTGHKRWQELAPAWRPALDVLSLTPKGLLDIIDDQIRGPQGEASLLVLISSSFTSVLRIEQILRVAREPSETWREFPGRGLRSIVQQVVREVGTLRVRAEIRKEVLKRALGD